MLNGGEFQRVAQGSESSVVVDLTELGGWVLSCMVEVGASSTVLSLSLPLAVPILSASRWLAFLSCSFAEEYCGNVGVLGTLP